MMTFSLSPWSSSVLPLMAASVKIRVVSWKDAADKNESLRRDALVIPNRIGLPTAGRLNSLNAFLLARLNSEND